MTTTGGELNLKKPNLNDDWVETIGTDLPNNFQKIDDEFSAHLAEVTQLPTEIVTVGSGGDFSNINEALEFLSKRKVRFFKDGYTAELKLLSGFVMEEQVLVKGANLGWITITAEDEEVNIRRSSLIKQIHVYSGTFPAFGAYNNGVLPIISVLFNMDNSGSGITRGGILLFNNSQAVVSPNCGIKNAGGDALHLMYSRINAYQAIFDNAQGNGIYATHASFVDAYGASVNNAGAKCLLAARNSTVLFQSASGINAGDIGIECAGGSIVNAYHANVSGAQTYGLLTRNSATTEFTGGNAKKSSTDSTQDIMVRWGSIIHAYSSQGGTSQAPNTITKEGIIFK